MSYNSRSRAYSKQGQQIGHLQLTVTHDHETKAATMRVCTVHWLGTSMTKWIGSFFFFLSDYWTAFGPVLGLLTYGALLIYGSFSLKITDIGGVHVWPQKGRTKGLWNSCITEWAPSVERVLVFFYTCRLPRIRANEESQRHSDPVLRRNGMLQADRLACSPRSLRTASHVLLSQERNARGGAR